MRRGPWAAVAATVAVAVAAIALCGSFGFAWLRASAPYIRPHVSEAKYNLKAAFTAERSFFQERDRYSEYPAEVGFFPERGNRYRYFFAPTSEGALPGAPDGGAYRAILADPEATPTPDNLALLAGVPTSLLAEAGVHGTCPEACSMTVIAAGNLDGDPAIDVWSISTRDRIIGEEKVPAGVPYQHFDDTTR